MASNDTKCPTLYTAEEIVGQSVLRLILAELHQSAVGNPHWVGWHPLITTMPPKLVADASLPRVCFINRYGLKTGTFEV